jgi:hypothetical protein
MAHRGNHGKAGYDTLSKGINQVKGFIFSESFHLDKAITYAAKTVYIASLKREESHYFDTPSYYTFESDDAQYGILMDHFEHINNKTKDLIARIIAENDDSE